jgi:hypothetical protein
MNWIERYGDARIRRRAGGDAALREVLSTALAGIHSLLEGWGRPYRLEAVLTRSGEYMIRIRVQYEDQTERDRIWDQAAGILETARAGREIHILCGIYRFLRRPVPKLN